LQLQVRCFFFSFIPWPLAFKLSSCPGSEDLNTFILSLHMVNFSP
jgi:hypothetical protein